MKIPEIYCMMFSNGKRITPTIREVLLINACDMALSGREQQKIKGRRYAGTISSDLKEWNYVGLTVIVFEADVVCPEVGQIKVRYGVRINDLDGSILARGKWSNNIYEMLEECDLLPKEDNQN